MTRDWDDVSDRFARLRRATSWPKIASARVETPAEKQAREKLDHINSWKLIAGSHALIEKLGGTAEMFEATVLLGLKASYEIALDTGWLKRGWALSAMDNSGQQLWDKPLGKQVGQFGPELTLDPSYCSEDVFQDALQVVGRRVRGKAFSQQCMVWGWLEDNLHCWPSARDILQFEGDLIESACDKVSRSSRRLAYRMVEALTQSRPVTDHIMGLVDQPFRRRGKVDPDVERGILLSRTEAFYDRARKKHDLKSEGTALKIHAHLALQVQKDDALDDGTLKAAILRVEAVPPRAKALPLDDDSDDKLEPTKSEMLPITDTEE